jgi:signal transduction histidine kinase
MIRIEGGLKMKRNVLIVDDDLTICTELQKELKLNYYNCFIALSSKEALKIMKMNKIDIIMLDVCMPDIDGLEFLQKIMKNVNTSKYEVIIMTGFSSQEVAIKALQRGAIDYLEKPINYDEMHTALGRAVEKVIEKEDYIFKHTVLVVDDDKQFTTLIKEILQKEGYAVYVANDGKQGLNIISKLKIDIILIDIELPIINGMDLLGEAKKYHKDNEVIMITGHGNEELAIKALRRGAMNYLRKPINLDEILIAVDHAKEKVILFRNQLYRNRELKINTEIVLKMNEELERRIEDSTLAVKQIQGQLFQTSKLATLGEMAAGLAHELNQPLTGISLTITNLKKLKKRDLLEETEIDNSIIQIDELVKRMSKIINHMRTFARQDSQKFDKVNINNSVDNALSLLNEQLRLHGIVVITNLEQNLPLINGEPYQIEQVIINIISNARDAIDEKAKCQPEQFMDWSKKLVINTLLVNNWVCIEISDNGIGMTEETKEKIFHPFYTTKEVGKATGLGMSISYGIVESHKGRIDVETEPGKGVKVSIKLPRERSEENNGENINY